MLVSFGFRLGPSGTPHTKKMARLRRLYFKNILRGEVLGGNQTVSCHVSCCGRTQPPLRISKALGLSLGLIIRHDLKNEAAGGISFSGIFPHSLSKRSSLLIVSFAVVMGEAMYESEKSGVPVNRRYI